MKLWLLKSIRGTGWDEVAAMVVRAPTEDAAREIAQKNGGDEVNPLRYRDPPVPYWLGDEYSTCEELTAGGEPGLIVRDMLEG